jgi:hypothetical protein
VEHVVKKNIEIDEEDEDYEDENDSDINYSPICSLVGFKEINEKLKLISDSITKIEQKNVTVKSSDSSVGKLTDNINSISIHFNCIICLDLVKGNVKFLIYFSTNL